MVRGPSDSNPIFTKTKDDDQIRVTRKASARAVHFNLLADPVVVLRSVPIMHPGKGRLDFTLVYPVAAQGFCTQFLDGIIHVHVIFQHVIDLHPQIRVEEGFIKRPVD